MVWGQDGQHWTSENNEKVVVSFSTYPASVGNLKGPFATISDQ